MKSLFLDAVLVRDVPVTTSPASDTFDPPQPDQQSYDCKAIVETYSQRLRVEGLVDQNDRKVLILAQSLTVVPIPGDRVTISGITFVIRDVATDPARAVWECRGRF